MISIFPCNQKNYFSTREFPVWGMSPLVPIIGVGGQSTLGQYILPEKNMHKKINKLPEFCMLFARKVNKMSACYIIFVRQIFFPDFTFFFGGGHMPPLLCLCCPPFLRPSLVRTATASGAGGAPVSGNVYVWRRRRRGRCCRCVGSPAAADTSGTRPRR